MFELSQHFWNIRQRTVAATIVLALLPHSVLGDDGQKSPTRTSPSAKHAEEPSTQSETKSDDSTTVQSNSREAEDSQETTPSKAPSDEPPQGPSQQAIDKFVDRIAAEKTPAGEAKDVSYADAVTHATESVKTFFEKVASTSAGQPISPPEAPDLDGYLTAFYQNGGGALQHTHAREFQSDIEGAPHRWQELTLSFIQEHPIPTFDVETFNSDKPHGNVFTMGHEIVSGRVTVGSMTVPFMYYNTLTGSRVAFIPPVEINRDDHGELQVFATDAETGLPIKIQPVLGEKHTKVPSEVEITIEFRFINDGAVRSAVLQAASKQLVHFEVDHGKSSTRPVERSSVQPDDVAIAAFTEVRIVCESPGLEDVEFTLIEGPSLSETVRCSTLVPPKFVNRLFSPAGVSFRAEYHFNAFQHQLTEVRADAQVDAEARIILEEAGKGGLSSRDWNTLGDGTRSHNTETKILVQRNTLFDVLQNSRFRTRFLVQGSNARKINTLMKLLGDEFRHLPAKTNQEIGDFLEQTLDWKRRLERKDGLVTSLANAASHEKLTKDDEETFAQALQALGKNTKAGFGIKALFEKLPIGLSFGKGTSTSEVQQSADYSSESKQAFLRNLDTFLKTGEFPVPSDLDLVLVSDRTISTALAQTLVLAEPTQVRQYKLSTWFNSAVRTDRRGSKPQPSLRLGAAR